MERDVRALVGDPRWHTLTSDARVHAMSRRMLATPDGTCWLFGAHARWYRLDRGDGRWHLSAPPLHPAVRTATRLLPSAPVIPLPLVPAGPDFAYERGSTQAFVGPDVPGGVTERVRDLLQSHRGLRRDEYPLPGRVFADVFAHDVTSPVAAVWGTIMWCAYAPAFDGNEVLLSMFGEFLGRPLPGDDWVRWLPPTPLDALVSLYAERIRSGAHEAALVLVRLMARTAAVLRADPRFAPRAQALLAMTEPVIARPWVDHDAVAGGAVRQAWLSRCPPHLAGATLRDLSPGEHFRHCLYDLVETLAYVSRRGMDPRATAAALLAADIMNVFVRSSPAGGAATQLYPWLDEEMRHALYAALSNPSHPLRGCWPSEGLLPRALMPPDRHTAAALLGSAYAMGLAWCRLTGTAPPPEGFAVSSAVVPSLIDERDDAWF
ncbi:hypothetical protein Pth03_08860 [Planotetraspora thailandica]|uniref:Uncharacterized protein n=2 Tax=Planotetraspora thailandica TaxID=487172 RepID=A0A8J3UZ39_9ACTN|nr:hypothetical protein Pth03_08860 [Planotetraspora thailandica]